MNLTLQLFIIVSGRSITLLLIQIKGCKITKNIWLKKWRYDNFPKFFKIFLNFFLLESYLALTITFQNKKILFNKFSVFWPVLLSENSQILENQKTHYRFAENRELQEFCEIPKLIFTFCSIIYDSTHNHNFKIKFFSVVEIPL